MYKLVNKYGNAVVETESAVKRDRLLKEGHRLVEEPPKAPKNKRKSAGAADNADKE